MNPVAIPVVERVVRDLLSLDMVADVPGISDADRRVRGAEYGVLGDLEVRVRGNAATLGGPKQRGVLAVLIAAAGRPVSVYASVVATYGDDAKPGSKATLHTYISTLRKALGDVIVPGSRLPARLLGRRRSVLQRLRLRRRCWRGGSGTGGQHAPAGPCDVARSCGAGIEANGHLDGEITRLSEMRLAALESRIDAGCGPVDIVRSSANSMRSPPSTRTARVRERCR